MLSRTTLVMTPKYWWAKKLRMSTTSRQGTSGRAAFRWSGSAATASPITTRL